MMLREWPKWGLWTFEFGKMKVVLWPSGVISVVWLGQKADFSRGVNDRSRNRKSKVEKSFEKFCCKGEQRIGDSWRRNWSKGGCLSIFQNFLNLGSVPLGYLLLGPSCYHLTRGWVHNAFLQVAKPDFPLKPSIYQGALSFSISLVLHICFLFL